MKKPTFYLGEFIQRDKKFITAEHGVDVEKVTSVAFDGETLYIAQPDCIVEYADGKTRTIAAKGAKLFTRGGKLYASVDNALAEIKKGKIKKLMDLDAPVIDISIALDNPFNVSLKLFFLDLLIYFPYAGTAKPIINPINIIAVNNSTNVNPLFFILSPLLL
jgi:hypothetical protein